MIGLGVELATTNCSRAGCRESAGWRLDWRNPRIHAEDRVKTWLACDLHIDYLRDFLESRDFPLAVSPVPPTTVPATTVPPTPVPPTPQASEPEAGPA